MNIEIKPTPGSERGTGKVVAAQAARLWQNAALPPLLSSFSIDALQGAEEGAPALPRALLLDALANDWLETAGRLGCVAVICQHRLWTAATVARVHGGGMRALSYTVNDEPTVQRLIKLAIDGIITDRVDFFKPF